MSNISKNVCDIPLTEDDKDKDQLEVSKYSNGLISFIEHCQTPMTISIQGEWGSGKTSLINKLNSKLKNKFDTYIINTWDYALINKDDIPMAILKDFLTKISEDETNNQISKKAGEIFKSFLKVGTRAVVSKYSEGMDVGDAAFDKFIKLPSLTDIKNDIKTLISEKYTQSEAKSKDMLSEAKSKDMLFFIDDLDRLNPVDAIRILELLKNLFDQPHCIFVLAIDYDVVVKGLKAKFNSDEKNEREYRQFFDKIVQLPFSMPISNYSLESYLKKLLVEEIVFIKDTEFTEYIKYIEPVTINTIGKNPRALKRVVNYLSLIKAIIESGKDSQEKRIEDKIVQYTLLCIQVGYPEVYSFLSKNPSFKDWNISDYTVEMFDIKINEAIYENEYFDEEWEQTLYTFVCSLNNKFLMEKVQDISSVLNTLKDFIEEHRADEVFSEIMEEMIQLSSITNATTSNKYPDTEDYSKIWAKLQTIIPKINTTKKTYTSNKIKLEPGYIVYIIKLNKKTTEIEVSYIKKGGTLYKEQFSKLTSIEGSYKKSDKQIVIKIDSVFRDENFEENIKKVINKIEEIFKEKK